MDNCLRKIKELHHENSVEKNDSDEIMYKKSKIFPF